MLAKEKIPNATDFRQFPLPNRSKGNDNSKNTPAPNRWLKALKGSLNPRMGYISFTGILSDIGNTEALWFRSFGAWTGIDIAMILAT